MIALVDSQQRRLDFLHPLYPIARVGWRQGREKQNRTRHRSKCRLLPFTRPNKRDRLVLSVGEAVRHDLMQTFSELRDSETNIRDMSPDIERKREGGGGGDRRRQSDRDRETTETERQRQTETETEREERERRVGGCECEGV